MKGKVIIFSDNASQSLREKLEQQMGDNLIIEPTSKMHPSRSMIKVYSPKVFYSPNLN
ncbi:MAG: hypothetical protein JXR07_20600 [Reichenbachiella sp.]